MPSREGEMTGLTVEYPGFFVQSGAGLLYNEDFVLEVADFDGSSSWLFWVTGYKRGHKETMPFDQNSHRDSTLAESSRREDALPFQGLILQNRKDEKEIGIPIPAVIVDIHGGEQPNHPTSEKTITCAYMCRAEVRMLGPKQEALSTILEEPGSTVAFAAAQTTNGNRMWCVG
jgi:hypothetical protein